MDIVLASASPRRSELLKQIGLEFRVCVSNAEEVIHHKEPSEVVKELSVQKAAAVYELLQGRQEVCDLIIGADTVVACDGKILGKPETKEDAVGMLRLLQGRSHEVYTGVCLIHGRTGARKSFFEETKVVFCPMTEEEITEYVNTKDCMDKAGSYGIQGFCARYIKGIEGDYNNVVGLPVCRLYQEIKSMFQE